MRRLLSQLRPQNWLETTETETRVLPRRPDIPIVRNLTWTRIHAIEFGIVVGALLVWAQTVATVAPLTGLLAVLVQILVSRSQKESARTSCTHDIGIHDVRQEPTAFATAAALVWIITTTILTVL